MLVRRRGAAHTLFPNIGRLKAANLEPYLLSLLQRLFSQCIRRDTTYETKILRVPLNYVIGNSEEAEGRRFPREDWVQNLQVSRFVHSGKMAIGFRAVPNALIPIQVLRIFPWL